MSKAKYQVEDCIKAYKEVACIPSLKSATFLDQDENILNICSSWSVDDLVTMEKTSFSRNYIYNKVNTEIILAGRPYDTNSVFRQAFSKSGKKQAIFRERKSQKNSLDYCDLEIWNEYQKEKTIDITEIDETGRVNNNNAFGCLSWSSDERYLIYTAEAKRPKTSSYFKFSKVNGEKEGKSKNLGNEYVYREEWGEDFVGSHHSVLVILDVETFKTEIVSIDKQYEEISIGESVWGPDDKTVVFVGYKEFPRRLGIRSCTNRSCAIYAYHRQTKKIECISGEKDVSVRCPRFSPDFKSLVYLENEIGGPHFKASKLQKCDWESRKISTVVTTVDYPKSDEFPGLYVAGFPKKCWFKNNYVFLTSQWRSYLSILCINIDNGKVQKIDPKIKLHPDDKDEKYGACIVHSVCENFILIELSSIIIEPCLALGCIQDDSIDDIKWKYLDSNAPIKHHNEAKWKILKVYEDQADRYFEIICTRPKNIDSPVRCNYAIIRPHGGPHAAHSAAFSKELLAYLKLGYMNQLVNYRGSTGFGERSLNSLPGNVGRMDVADIEFAAICIKDSCYLITDVFVIGGSHGGFLAAHVAGQTSNPFSGIVLQNPVIDFTSMLGTTDIPDWNYVEAGCGDMDQTKVVTPEQLNTMFEKSPIKYAENIRSPVLLLLGSKDLRVPYSQGLELYHLLKAKKHDVSIYVYEDNHNLGKTPHDADVFMQTILFLENHTKNTSCIWDSSFWKKR